MLLGFKIFFMVYKLGLKKKEPKQCLKLSEEEMMQNIHLLGRRTELMQRAARLRFATTALRMSNSATTGLRVLQTLFVYSTGCFLL